MRTKLTFAAMLALTAGACAAPTTNQGLPTTLPGSSATVANDGSQPAVDLTSVLKLLTKQTVIGSTIDPANGDQNPYGLVYVATKPFGKALLKKGDLAVCNFNNSANVQGSGTTVEYMTSTPGSQPKRLLQSASLLGCASLAIDSFDDVYPANSGAKRALEINPSGKIQLTLKNSRLVEPWGSAFVPGQTSYPPGPGLWVGDASSGKIVRINLGTGGSPTYTAVISGFAVNHGKPGSILGPSGMQYNYKTDTLYVVDGVTNTVVSIAHAYRDLNSANAIIVGTDGKSFTGRKAKDAHLIFSGTPLNGPISSTLLPNGNLVVGNTLDPAGTNLLVEIANNGKLLDTENIDQGAAGALFGIASSGTSDATTKIYFNDDNANNVQVLSE